MDAIFVNVNKMSSVAKCYLIITKFVHLEFYLTKLARLMATGKI